MTRGAIVVVLILMANLAWASPQHRSHRELHGIKGPVDQRSRVAAGDFPWSAVGRLNNGHGGHCSATLIGPRLVATAAHCLWSQRARRMLPASAFTFVAGLDRGVYLRASKVRAIHRSPTWDSNGAAKGLAGCADDWALLELVEPVGDDVGWIGLAEPETGMAVAVVGYGRDKAYVPLAHVGCRLKDQPHPGVFLHTCDAVEGQSGGPALAVVDDEIRLVAVNVAVIPARGEAGVAAGIGALMPLAESLGADGSTRMGPLSRTPEADPLAPLR